MDSLYKAIFLSIVKLLC